MPNTYKRVRNDKRSRREQQDDEHDGRTKRQMLVMEFMRKPTLNVFTNEDLVYIIMSFLNTEELFCLAFCNKLLRSVLDYEHVVQAALFQDDDEHVQHAIRCVYELVMNRQIYIPSPQRLLRMVNAKQCEQEGCTQHVWYSNPRMRAFGVMFCRQHFMESSSKLIKVTTKKWWPILDEPRTANHRQYANAYHLWFSPYRDTSGEMAGPILTMKDYKARSIKALLNTRDTADPHANDAVKIVQAFEEAESESLARRARLEQAREEEREAKEERRREKIYQVIEKLSRLLDDWELKDIALAYHDIDSIGFRTPLVEFEWKLVDIEMKPLLTFLSKATNEAIKEVAERLRSEFDMMYHNNYGYF